MPLSKIAINYCPKKYSNFLLGKCVNFFCKQQ